MLVLAVLLPGLVGAAWIIANTFRAERLAHERGLRDTARALSMVVDGELAQRAAVAHVLAQSRWLDGAPQLTRAQLDGFERLARRAMVGMDGWLVLRSADRVLLDTRNAPGAAPVFSTAALIATPRVLPLQMGAGEAAGTEAHASVVEPVERDGRVLLNVSVALRPRALQRIVDAQKLPADWVGTVMDDRGIVIARHPGGGSNIGRQATADLRARMVAAKEGLFESVSLDGRHATGYYSTSTRGWSYISAMPREQYRGLSQRAVWQVGLGVLVLVALAVLGAMAVARGIVVPVQALKTAAARLQAGQAIPPGSTGIAEYDEVTRALATASVTIASGRAELEHQVAEAVARTRQAEQHQSQGQRVEALGRLTGGVAHEFNNLLGIVSNSAHLIARHPAAAELEAALAATRRAVQTGHQLTQHLLRFADRSPSKLAAVALDRYLPEVEGLIRSLLGRRIELMVQVAAGTAPVLVDAGGLDLALINLTLNARDAMPEGGGLRVAARNATAEDLEDFADVAGSPAGPAVLVTVRDDGAGMTSEVTAHVFEPFFTTKPFGTSAGMGLSQVHGFCTQSGGAVRVASTPGLGTTVLMLLPVAPSQAAVAGPPGARASVSIAGARVLLVDDNVALAEVTALLLSGHGAHVQCAADAQQALQRVAAEPAFDVVLTDVVMTGEPDGLGLARQLRQTHPTLAVVLISGYSNAAARTEFSMLEKPCPPDALLAALSQAIATTARLREEAAALQFGGRGNPPASSAAAYSFNRL